MVVADIFHLLGSGLIYLLLIYLIVDTIKSKRTDLQMIIGRIVWVSLLGFILLRV